ncbi:hypothetical protein FA13DRAFT_1793784 [Coprinellus micaceus]|uniref:Uncharacterized protein n=1 Tax=Coprinellus micaceus TaxID=71717 RepID=A0A4Y7T3R4_COPMI|nr:hypothetical protein FA13DRAFT_1793784 [Coprinellus micaceus]
MRVTQIDDRSLSTLPFNLSPVDSTPPGIPSPSHGYTHTPTSPLRLRSPLVLRQPEYQNPPPHKGLLAYINALSTAEAAEAKASTLKERIPTKESLSTPSSSSSQPPSPPSIHAINPVIDAVRLTLRWRSASHDNHFFFWKNLAPSNAAKDDTAGYGRRLWLTR